MILDVTGGHWLVLQTVAWSQMIVDYSRNAPIKQAIRETFDGAHPCDLCKSIQKAKQSEKKQEAQQVALKRDFFFEVRGGVLHLPRHFQIQMISEFSLNLRTDRPFVPPPRSLLG